MTPSVHASYPRYTQIGMMSQLRMASSGVASSIASVFSHHGSPKNGVKTSNSRFFLDDEKVLSSATTASYLSSSPPLITDSDGNNNTKRKARVKEGKMIKSSSRPLPQKVAAPAAVAAVVMSPQPAAIVATSTTTAFVFAAGSPRWTKEELKAAFLMLDQNKDGNVNASELQTMLLNLGIHLKEELIHELIRQAGCTGHGINETEFMEWMGKLVMGTSSSSAAAQQAAKSALHEHLLQQQQEHASHSSPSSSSNSRHHPASEDSLQAVDADEDDVTQDLIAAFTVFDRDGNGYITRDELKLAMDLIGEPMTDPQLDHMLELADIDKDGRINYQEFLRILL